jgi:DNA-binding NtrC family response regulator
MPEGVSGNELAAELQAEVPTLPVILATGYSAENTAEIAILKGQIATLMQTAQTLKTQMLKNEVGIQNNTNSIQKVVQSQTNMQTKLANAKSKQ